MVKAYLRYDGADSIGVVASRECNVALDRAGAVALTGCVEAVGVWNLRSGVQVRALKAPKSSERVTRLCLKEGRQPICAAGYAEGSVRLWNFEEGALLQTFHGHRSFISCLAFDRAGQLLASGSGDTDVVVWDVAAESGVARLRGHVDQVTAVLFWEAAPAPGAEAAARLVSASKDRFIRIWSIELQLCLQTIAEHKVEVWSLALNAAQTRLAAGAADKFLRLWALSPEANASEGQQLAAFHGAVPRPEGQGMALGLQFATPKSLGFEVLACQGSGRTLEFWRCHDTAEVKKRSRRRRKRAELKQQKAKAKAEKGAAEAKEEEDDEKEENEEPEAPGEAAEGAEGPQAADELAAMPTHRCGAKALSMAWCAEGSVALVGLTTNALESVRMLPGEESGTAALEPSHGLEAPGHRTGVRCLAVAHDDSLLMSASAEAVKIWNTTTHRVVRTIASGYGLCGLFVAGNEHVLLGTKEGGIELYDLRVGELAQREEAHTSAIYGLAEQPDHKGFVSCSADKHLRFFELDFTQGATSSCSFKEVPEKATELPDEGLAVAYAPNGTWVAVALLNSTVQLVFADSLKFYLSLYGHRLPVMSVDFSSDSQIIASGSADKSVKLWSTQFGNCHRSLRAHGESVMQVRFLPGTHYLASAGRDRELKLWDCDSYELITALKGHAADILSLALSQDAAFIVTGSSDRQIRFWKRSQDQLFLSEERAKEMEEKFEQEVEREDVQQPAGGEAVTLRPSRRTVESVRSTERLMEVLDEATAEADEDGPPKGGRHPVARVVGYIGTLTANNIYEVLLALPFSYALRLLGFICRFFEAVAALPAAAGGADGGARTRALSAAAALETPCQAALITTYVHHSELASTPSARPLILKLRQHMRELLQAEKDRIGLSMAGFAHLQRVLKRSGGPLSALGPAAPAGAAGRPAAKKQRR